MHPQLREFVFRVDTEEVLDAPPPPAPVFASPRRRASQPPTVALRLPDLRLATAPEGSSRVDAVAANSLELPIPRQSAPAPSTTLASSPIVSFPTAPKVEPAKLSASLDEREEAVVAQLVPTASTAVSPPPGTAAVTAAPDTEAFWKNPKFMLAGVAAAFLGMVSLMAMNHEPTPAGDDAPAWSGTSAASTQAADHSSNTPFTPLVVRGDDPSPGVSDHRSDRFGNDRPPTERTAFAPSRETRYSEPPADSVSSNANQQDPWADSTAGTERIDFGDDLEGTARLVEPLPNFASPVEREADHESTQADGSYR